MTKADFLAAYPRWTVEWGYGSWHAIHDNYDASYEGPEDGWVSNGLDVWGSDFDELAEEIDALILERPTFFSASEIEQVQDRERNQS